MAVWQCVCKTVPDPDTERESFDSGRSSAVIRLAGPLMSIGLAVVSLFLIPLGGLFVIAGSAGFTMNLLNGVFSLVPVSAQ